MARNLKDAFYNAQYRVGQGIITRAESQGEAGNLTNANFESYEQFSNLVDDATVMGEFAANQLLMTDVSESSEGMNTVAGSQTAMDAVAGSQTAMDAVIASQLALDTVVASQLALDTVVASQTAMDAVAGSQTARDVIGFSGLAYDTIANSNMAIGKYAVGYTNLSPSDYADMDAVAGSQTAMDAVAGSQTARDVIGFSGLAYDTIANSNMAIGKYAIGYTTESPSDYSDMDAVAGSQTAMDAVAGSDLAVQTVFGSLLSRTIALSSNFVQSLWDKERWSLQTIQNSNLTSGEVNADANTVQDGDLGISISPEANFGPQGEESYLSFEIEADNYTELNLDTVYNDNGANCVSLLVQVGSSELTVGSTHSRTNRTLDISGESGTVTLKIGFRETAGCGSFGQNSEAEFFKLELN